MKGGIMTLAQDLRMREPALAMLMGALSPDESVGPNVGFGWGDHGHHPYGYHPNSLQPYEPLEPHHHHYNQVPYYPYLQPSIAPPPPPPVPYEPPPPYGYDDSMGYGYGFGAPPIMPSATPIQVASGVHSGMQHGHHAHAAWQLQNPSSTMSRTLLLDPNRDSIVKVERYSFSFSPSSNLVLGTASNIVPFTQQPSTSIKGQRVIMNAPVPGFVLISSLQVANVNVLVGGTEDAYTYSAGAQGVVLDLPRLDPQNRATSAGAYTGVLPSGYTQGNSFQFIITLQGPSTLAGGYGQ
jgi:hypothetical protein